VAIEEAIVVRRERRVPIHAFGLRLGGFPAHGRAIVGAICVWGGDRTKTVSYCSESCQTNHWQLHKADCKRPNYLIKFHLCPDDIVDPPVWRKLSCPAIATFYTLHYALQIAFGWTHNHAYDFKVKDPQYREPEGDEGFLAEVRSLMNTGPIS
jgi:hypothetical protein